MVLLQPIVFIMNKSCVDTYALGGGCSMNSEKFKVGMPVLVVLLLALAQSKLTTIANLKAERIVRAQAW